MIKKIIRITMMGIGISLLVSSCYYDKFDELHPIINSGCDSATATWGGQVSKVVNTYCISCHSGSTANGGIVLDNYNSVKSAAANGSLMNALKGNGVPSMPPNTHLDDCKIGSIQHWINNGMPNN